MLLWEIAERCLLLFRSGLGRFAVMFVVTVSGVPPAFPGTSKMLA
jgi:hypothetical protein